jgi:hypothetical protein
MSKMRICGIILLAVSTMVTGTGAVSAQSQTSAPPPSTTVPPPPPMQSLPRPDFRYKGQVGRTYQDSDPPTFPQKEKNWIKTVPGKGWFPYLRFYSPTEAFFNQTWKPDDIVEVN